MAGSEGAQHEVVIEAVGARGDGVARLRRAKIFVRLTLPGDRLRVRIIGRRRDGLLGEPVEWFEQAPRAEPPCPHFGVCGGCQLQHVPLPQYGAWKRQQVAAALAQRGLEHILVAPLVRTQPAAVGARGSRSSARARRFASVSGSEPDIG